MESENFAFFANEYQKCQIPIFCEVSLASVAAAGCEPIPNLDTLGVVNWNSDENSDGIEVI
jgi:hypothetical protein